MKRFTGRAWLVVAGVAIVLAMTHVAEAQQRGEGGRGRGGRGMGRGGFALTTVQLATAEEVQAALKLTDEQKGKVEQINDELRQARRELRDQGGDDFRAMMAEMQKLNDEAATKLTAALDEAQNQQLIGILAQVDVDAALSNSTIAKELNITDEQKEALGDVRNDNRDARNEAMRELGDLSREERTAKMGEIRAEEGKKLLAALTTDQQAKYEALKGEPVKVDMAQFGFGGRGGRGGREGGGRGDRGNREGGQGAAAESDRGA